jgi:RNA recognition motif-containing protein
MGPKNKLYVGNLPYSVTNDDLKSLFSEFGEVADARVITDRHSGRSKGFGFVEFANEDDAQKAIDQLNNKDFMGMTINVSIARPQEERSGGGGGRGGFGGGRGGFGGGGGRGGDRGGFGGGRGGDRGGNRGGRY